jgi:orotate phosphoribosyltransferase
MTKGWIDSVKEKVFAPVELEDWKKNYIDWLDKNSVLKFGKFKLKSGRTSYSFANFGDVSDGISISSLGDYYAAAIDRNVEGEFKTIVGPAYKGISLAVTTAISLSRRRGKPVSFTYDRKEEKAYGEATNVSKAEAAKKMFLGYIPQNVPENKDRIVYIDDVITTGATKIEEDNKLKSVANVDVAGLFVALNRQEIDENGNDAVKELSTKLKTPVHAVANLLSEAVPYLAQKGRIDETIQRKHVAYTRAYGIEEVKPWCRDIRFIERDKGLIPSM